MSIRRVFATAGRTTSPHSAAPGPSVLKRSSTNYEKKDGIGGDLCALKINANGSIKIRPYGYPLLITNCSHPDCLPFGEFVT